MTQRFNGLVAEVKSACVEAARKVAETHGIEFNEEAFWSQATFCGEEPVKEMVMFGMGIFPAEPEDDGGEGEPIIDLTNVVALQPRKRRSVLQTGYAIAASLALIIGAADLALDIDGDGHVTERDLHMAVAKFSGHDTFLRRVEISPGDVREVVFAYSHKPGIDQRVIYAEHVAN